MTDLRAANLSEANLSGADLSGADLYAADLSKADLREANLSEAFTGHTVFANNDLSSVQGLETVRHYGPSTIGTDTLFNSGGNIPESFLRGCGVQADLIEYLPALIGAMQPIQFYSCFISYSSKDEGFARRLYADLQGNNVRCWFAPEDLKIGERIRIGIDEAIRFHDKLLLVLSKSSVESDWVEKEVETAMEQERRQKRTVLFPIRLDNTAMEVDTGWAADVGPVPTFVRWSALHEELRIRMRSSSCACIVSLRYTPKGRQGQLTHSDAAQSLFLRSSARMLGLGPLGNVNNWPTESRNMSTIWSSGFLIRRLTRPITRRNGRCVGRS